MRKKIKKERKRFLKKEEERLLHLAKAFEHTTLSKSDAVNKFGTEGQKNNFNKNNRFTGNTAKSFRDTLEQLFNEVDDKVKFGKGYGYKLGAAKHQISERVDNRVNNKGVELSYTKYLDAIVLLSLDSEMFTEHETTMSKWVLNFGLANELIYQLKSNPNSVSSTIIKNQLPTSKKPELDIYTEDFKDKERILRNTLEKMDKMNLIDFFAVPKASIITGIKYMTDEGEPVYDTGVIDLKSETVKFLNEKRREVIQELGLTEFIVRKGNSANKETQNKINEFNRIMEDFYKNDVYQVDDDGNKKQIWVRYHWFNHAVIVKATKTRIKNYLKKHRADFYADYIEDSKMFLTNSQENYQKERFKTIIKKAKLEREKVICQLIKEKEEEESSGLNFTDKDSMRKFSYWENDYIENVEKLEEVFRPDFHISPRHEK